MSNTPAVFGVPIEFLLFGATLLSVAIFHHQTLRVALVGLAAITSYKLAFTGFPEGSGVAGLVGHLQHEWVLLANLLFLLIGFELLSKHFEESRVPELLPRFLPDNWVGGWLLLLLVFILSGFLDNIAAALVGATVAGSVYRHRVHIGFLAALVAAANAGGAGSALGDTTTTMMWLAGVSPLVILPAYIASFAALLVFGVPAAMQQQRYSPIQKDPPRGIRIDWARVGIVVTILAAAIATNVVVNMKLKHLADAFPFIGVSVWIALLLCAPLAKPDWSLVPGAFKGTVFLLALVTCASMMPVKHLPDPSWVTTFALGFVSALFDNIPLTALALQQGGYDWALLAYAVGFGGSMIWFGSSAGVAVSNLYPEAKSVWSWVKNSGWIVVGYVVGFFVLLAFGWNPRQE